MELLPQKVTSRHITFKKLLLIDVGGPLHLPVHPTLIRALYIAAGQGGLFPSGQQSQVKSDVLELRASVLTALRKDYSWEGC